MATHYTTKDIIQSFSVSHETAKKWAREFAPYLSPTATPPAGQRRAFTPDDMRVFALVADYKSRGLTFADAHTALQIGERLEVPTPPSALDNIQPVVRDIIVTLRSQIETLQAELETEKAKTNQAVGQTVLLRDLLKEMLAEKEAQIKALYIELGSKK